MLLRYFKTAAELGITDAQLEALIKVLEQLERGELHDPARYPLTSEINNDLKMFSMKCWGACIREHANRVNDSFSERYAQRSDGALPPMLNRLFWSANLTMPEATAALRDYLTTGKQDG